MAKELSTKAQEIEEKELGARPERMADLFFLKALIQDEVCMYLYTINICMLLLSSTSHIMIQLTSLYIIVNTDSIPLADDRFITLPRLSW